MFRASSVLLAIWIRARPVPVPSVFTYPFIWAHQLVPLIAVVVGIATLLLARVLHPAIPRFVRVITLTSDCESSSTQLYSPAKTYFNQTDIGIH